MGLFWRTLTVGLVTAVLWPWVATANSINDLASTVFGSGMTYVPPADLTGWFFNPEGLLPFPLAPDPSQPWTSPENIAALKDWLGVVSDLGGDPGIIERFPGSGDQAQIDSMAAAQDTGTPEPPEWALAATGLLMVGAIAEVRRRRKRRRYL
jgi:hypothetical protein